MTNQLPAQISKWEIAGIPAAMILGALYEMESLPVAVKSDLPRYMLLLYVIVAIVRVHLQRKAKTDTMTGTRQTRTDISTDEK